MIRNFLLIQLLAIWLGTGLNAQSLPKIGDPMPDFVLNDVRYYNTNKVSLNDFKGKWLFLDFWFVGCTSCIQSFPKINALQEKFKDRAVFMLVGLNDSQQNKGIAELYEKFRVKQHLNIPVAYDSVLAGQLEINSYPHVFIIDPEGKLHNISDGRDFTEENIGELVNGKNIKMFNKTSASERFDAKNVYKDKVLYRSVISEWNNELQSVLKIEDAVTSMKENNAFVLSNVPLKFLYRIAYTGYASWDSPADSLYGKVYQQPVLKIKDSSHFKYNYNSVDGSGRYNYSLSLPASQVSALRIMDILKNDLRNTFGYTVDLQDEEVPVLKLVIKDKRLADKLRSRGKGKQQINAGEDASGGAAGFEAKNLPVDYFLQDIIYYLWMGRPPYFDETGIKGNIDINFKAILTDWNDVIRELNRHGLDLVKGTRKMKCIVISE